MEKSPEAFRTISEVADWLGVPTHVLRFWESRFSQVKPVKRAGGRRYYRPTDMQLIGGIKRLLHDEGMTIRGVQKLLREEGVKHVQGFSQPLSQDAMIDVTPDAVPPSPMAVDVEPEPLDNVVPIEAETTEDEPAPELTFLHRAATPAAEPEQAAPQADLFTSRRARPADEMVVEEEPEAATPARTIPETPDVPEADPADDAPAFARGAGPAARLRASFPNGLRIDTAVLARVRGELRAYADSPRG